MLSVQERVHFNYLRTEFYVSGRMLFLNDQCWTGAIMYGYAIESFLKQALLEAGNKKIKLQHSHDLKLLFNECKQKGLFNDIQVPEDFIDYSNSLFQMRYPSSSKKEALKAYEHDNVMSVTKTYLFCYDEYFQQLDEAVYNFTNDPYSSSVLKVFARITSREAQFGLYCNSAALEYYDLYRQRIGKYFPKNMEANELLQNSVDYFWGDAHGFKIYATLEHFIHNHELPKFRFPGKLYRDEFGKVTKLEV
jgi:hypothetical protein